MGWKNVKDHYWIEHIVHVRGGKICIGSGYVSNIIEIENGKPQWATSLGPGNADLERYMAEMEADLATLAELIASPDKFERNIKVWTCDYYEGEIIEKQCEEPGWPNITHDGDLMYENSFSTDRAKIVEYAKRNAATGLELAERAVIDAEREVAEHRARRDQYAAALQKLEVE